MYPTVLFTALLVTVAVAEDLPILGIIGGSTASPGQFPYQVALERNGKQHCGGTIIARKKIMTAAHCVHGISLGSLKILAGTNNRLAGGKRFGVAKSDVHENYAPPATPYDIAIITLTEELTFGATTKAAALPEKDEILVENKMAIVSGWGAQYHQGPTTTELKYVQIPLWGRARCQQYVPNLPSTHICAGDSLGQMNSCPGDSGGPLAIGDKVIGIVSFGYGCGAAYRPAMYTHVGGLRDWIRKKANV